MPVNQIAKKKLPWTYTQFWLCLPTLQRPEGFRAKSPTETYKIRRLIHQAGASRLKPASGKSATLNLLATQDLKFPLFRRWIYNIGIYKEINFRY